ncbi:hypothetical protein QZH41_013689 [Actinostola sp. cb2023]|nr:hypothetical protein QZH41_013689 [Actinostola sp. cb2023]
MDILARIYNPCAVEQPCKNNGTCIVNHNNGTFRCECNEHYTGTQCERLAPPKSIGNLNCAGQVLNLCKQHMTAWKATILGPTSLDLMSCNPKDVENTTELLVFVSRADVSDYGSYEIVRVKDNIGCIVTLLTPMNKTLSGSPCEIIAQRLPNFDNVTLSQSCQLTCNARSGVVGGILALRAAKLTIDSSSKIDVNGKGKETNYKLHNTECANTLIFSYSKTAILSSDIFKRLSVDRHALRAFVIVLIALT